MRQTIFGRAVVDFLLFVAIAGLILSATVPLLTAILWLCLLSLGFFWVAAIWLISQGVRVLQAGVFPAPGMQWAAKETVRTGRGAQFQGLFGVVSGGFVFLFVPIAAVYILRA
jgi:hypothetical protein